MKTPILVKIGKIGLLDLAGDEFGVADFLPEPFDDPEANFDDSAFRD